MVQIGRKGNQTKKGRMYCCPFVNMSNGVCWRVKKNTIVLRMSLFMLGNMCTVNLEPQSFLGLMWLDVRFRTCRAATEIQLDKLQVTNLVFWDGMLGRRPPVTSLRREHHSSEELKDDPTNLHYHNLTQHSCLPRCLSKSGPSLHPNWHHIGWVR